MLPQLGVFFYLLNILARVDRERNCFIFKKLKEIIQL